MAMAARGGCQNRSNEARPTSLDLAVEVPDMLSGEGMAEWMDHGWLGEGLMSMARSLTGPEPSAHPHSSWGIPKALSRKKKKRGDSFEGGGRSGPWRWRWCWCCKLVLMAGFGDDDIMGDGMKQQQQQSQHSGLKTACASILLMMEDRQQADGWMSV